MLPECCYEYRYEDPKAKIFTVCDVCGEAIYVGDSYYRIENLDVCNDCINTFKVLAEEE
ncbi:hypothetical protein ACFHWD_18215 [Clostridium sp. MT-14]|uniref:Phage protein n=1 Tax=Clostridium aromativorans TaxID=2836848 RepID=A0ABS8N9K3_9CLOT|nr:hypothetical protein [Clostridium aromativorans]MCC9296479.1 hypothetical protein [Clostridium aromativorans]CAB1262836.1 conserved hypothetical protein [Clostridiaceae bacterium BL-3]